MIVLCAAVGFAPELVAQQPTVEGDVKSVRELLRRTNRSGRFFKENAKDRLADWKAAAEKGSAEGLWLLGRCYLDGHAGLADEEKGIELVRKSADKGFGLAMNELGYSYENGDGVAKELKEAVKWYRKGAERGELVCCYNLALRYEDGSGVEASAKDALTWFRKAAEGRHQPALRRLAAMYESGSGGVSKDALEAVKWYRRLGEAGDPKGTAKVALMYEKGDGVPKDAAEAKRTREVLRTQAGAGAEDYILLVDVLNGAMGKKAPNMKGVIDGKPFKLSDHAGKVVVLRFTAAWCGHCRKMNPRLEALVKKHDPKAFAVVDVDIDKNPDLAELWEVTGVPEVYVLDAAGVIRDIGSRDEDLDKAVNDLLAKAKKKDK
jgi:TPR repeat protein/thiol-disulfide isomerase/thioredoxin